MFRDRGILCLAVGQTLIWATAFYVFPASLIRWETAFGWSRPVLTGAITLAICLTALASPLAGRLIDRGRGPWMTGVASAIAGALLALTPFVQTIWQFYLVWAGIGVVLAGCLYEATFAIITRARGGDARGGIVLVTLAAGFASTLAFPSVHYLSEAFGWRTAILIFAGVAVVLAAPLNGIGAALVSDRVAEAPSTSAAESRAFLKRPAFWRLAFAFALTAIAHGVTLHHLLPMLSERGLPAATAVLAASAIGPMQVAGRLVIVAAGDRLSPDHLSRIVFVAIGVALGLLLLAGASVVLIGLAVALFGAAYGVTSIVRPLIARQILGGADFGAKTGALALPYLMGAASAPYLGAVLWSVGGYDLAIALMIGLSALGFVLYLLAHLAR